MHPPRNHQWKKPDKIHHCYKRSILTSSGYKWQGQTQQ
uniref:Uncharacterized protein n=1 Tax=Anguilla anguilla TaxID=7936 RepID=A0A0E9PQU9_ANGAN